MPFMDDDLHRTNLNLYRKDVQFLQTMVGRNWTLFLRNMIHDVIDRWEHSSDLKYTIDFEQIHAKIVKERPYD